MSAIPAPLRLASPWPRALALLAALAAAIGLLYRHTAMAMVGIWSSSDTYAHGFLVLPLSLWLVWRQRDRLALLSPEPSPWMLTALAVAAAAWLGGELVVVNAASQFAFVTLLVLAVPAVLGTHVAKAVLFPLLFLYFSVPFGEFMLQPMMEWTADFVVAALRLSGIPVYREGLQFVIPSGNWSVIDECSGVRYLIASFMVGSLFAYLNYRSPRRRVVFMLVSLLVPIVANWLRAYIIVMMGHLSGNRIAVGVDHLLYGWVFFGIVIFVMFTIGMRWSEPDAPLPDAPSGAAAGTAGRADWSGAATAALAALIVAGPHALMWKLRSTDVAAASPAVAWPDQLAPGWAALDADLAPGWKPHYPGSALQTRRVWQGPRGRVGVHLAYYRAQTPESKLVSSINGVVSINDRIWNRVASSVQEVGSAAAPLTLRGTEILGPQASGDSRRPHLFVWHAYWIDGHWIVSDPVAKLRNAAARIAGRGDDAAAVLLYADEGSPEASQAALRDFAESNLGPLNRLLTRARDAR